MNRTRTAFGIGAIAAALMAAFAPSASAADPAPVQGWNPSDNYVCNGSAFPVIVGNYTPNAMTGSYTIPSNLGEYLQVFDTLSEAQAAYGCTGQANGVAAPSGASSANFTVQPYSANVMWAVAYGKGSNYVMGFGGAPNGTRGAGWYDMGFDFNPMNGNVESLTANYSGTGGTNGSNQDNFNLVACNVGTDTVGLTSNVITPYSSGQSTISLGGYAPPVCAAWMPQGTMVNFNSTPSGGVTAQAAQVNGSTVSFAGNGATSGMVMAYQVQGTSDPAYDPNAIIQLAITPGSAPFLTVNAAGEWAALNIPNPGTGLVNLLANGQVIASWNTQS